MSENRIHNPGHEERIDPGTAAMVVGLASVAAKLYDGKKSRESNERIADKKDSKS